MTRVILPMLESSYIPLTSAECAAETVSSAGTLELELALELAILEEVRAELETIPPSFPSFEPTQHIPWRVLAGFAVGAYLGLVHVFAFLFLTNVG